MNDTITITLTREEKAAAKRLVRLQFFGGTTSARNVYRTEESHVWLCRMQGDKETLISAVLRGIKKGGAK